MKFVYSFPCPYCKKEAFASKVRPRVGDVIFANDIILSEANTPSTGDNITCQFCKEEIEDRYLDPVNFVRRLALVNH